MVIHDADGADMVLMGYGDPAMMAGGYGDPGMMGYGDPAMMGYGDPAMMAGGYFDPGMIGPDPYYDPMNDPYYDPINDPNPAMDPNNPWHHLTRWISNHK